MEHIPQPRARLIVDVMEHGTVVGTDEPVSLEFEDCVNAVTGLVAWMADTFAEVNEAPAEEIGTAILVDALHHWTFDETIDESDRYEEPEGPLSELN